MSIIHVDTNFKHKKNDRKKNMIVIEKYIDVQQNCSIYLLFSDVA